jgi:hypothetical protein
MFFKFFERPESMYNHIKHIADEVVEELNQKAASTKLLPEITRDFVLQRISYRNTKYGAIEHSALVLVVSNWDKSYTKPRTDGAAYSHRDLFLRLRYMTTAPMGGQSMRDMLPEEMENTGYCFSVPLLHFLSQLCDQAVPKIVAQLKEALQTSAKLRNLENKENIPPPQFGGPFQGDQDQVG